MFFAIKAEYGFLILDDTFQMNCASPEAIHMRKCPFQIFQIQLNALVLMLQHKLPRTIEVSVLNDNIGGSSVNPRFYQLIPHILPALVGNLPFWPLLLKNVEIKFVHELLSQITAEK